MVIQTLLLAATSVVWSIAFAHSTGQAFTALLKSVLIEYFAVGAVVATIGRVVCTRMVEAAPEFSSTPAAAQQAASAGSRIEWAYCFDVHCNSYFPFFLATHVCAFVAAPLFLASSLGVLATMMANTLYAAAAVYYCYVTFLGYQTLCNLRDARVFLLAVVAIFAAWLVLTALGQNVFVLALRLHYP